MMDRSQCKGRSSKPADTAWSGWALISPMTPINPFTAYVRKKKIPLSLSSALHLSAALHAHTLPVAIAFKGDYRDRGILFPRRPRAAEPTF